MLRVKWRAGAEVQSPAAPLRMCSRSFLRTAPFLLLLVLVLFVGSSIVFWKQHLQVSEVAGLQEAFGALSEEISPNSKVEVVLAVAEALGGKEGLPQGETPERCPDYLFRVHSTCFVLLPK